MHIWKSRITVKRVIAGILILWMIFIIAPKPNNHSGVNPLMKTDGGMPILIAHGGGNHEFPDNTLEAFYHAYSIDSNVMMETDVNMTKDGVIILSHDTTLDEKTTLTYAPIIDTNYSDLVSMEIDFGYHNDVQPSSNGFNVSGILKPYQTYLGESVTPLDVSYPEGTTPRHDTKFLVTTLEDLIKAFPSNLINVEIKQSGEIGLESLAKVIELLDMLDDDYDTYSRIVLASFHTEVFEQMKNLKKTSHPELMISPEQSSVIKFYALQTLGLSLFYFDQVSALQLPLSSFGLSLSHQAIIRNAQRKNIAVHYWTIDDPIEMRRLIENGADGIMTNRPSVLKEVIDSYITSS
jgi:glycerophosphoryl diester phosphodiesterase